MATTSHNTGLSLARNGNKFTASWKIKTKTSYIAWQKIRYRTHNGTSWGDWTEKTVGNKATTYSFTLGNSGTIKRIQFETKIKRTGYTASSWDDSLCTFTVSAPAAPSLTITKNSANQTSFAWSESVETTGAKWLYTCYYRTKCDNDPNGSDGWGSWTKVSSSGSLSYTDTDTGVWRVFEVYAKGPGGTSAVVRETHYIGLPPAATWSAKGVTVSDCGSYYEMTYNAIVKSETDQVDEVVPQYYIGSPASDMSMPSGASQTDGASYSAAPEKTDYPLAISTSDVIDEDECLWALIKTTHDSNDVVSDAVRVLTGKLKAPSASFTMGTISSSGFSVDITVSDAGTDVPGAYVEVYLEKASAPGNYILIGTMANGTSSATISSALDITEEDGYAIHIRNVTADGVSMVSSYTSYASSMPTAPTLSSVKATTTSGKVYAAWTNNWSSANGVIIAWTDDPDNWMSNKEPETYEISELASSWYITGLETGQKWYFRVRNFYSDGDTITYTPWSDDVSVDLSSAPAAPALYLSEETITEDGMVTAYWVYASTDGTPQMAGDIVEMTYSSSSWVAGDIIASVESAQHVDIYAEDKGWNNGDIVYMALRTRSGSGGVSDYSTPVRLVIAALPEVDITSTGLSASETITEYFIGDGDETEFTLASEPSASPTVEVNGEAESASYSGDTLTLSTAPDEGAEIVVTYSTDDNTVLDDLPLSVTVTTSAATELSLAIERAADYPIIRPDGTQTDGASGETIYVNTIPAEASNTFSIALDDLVGRLDDGARYSLIATAYDAYGQTAEDSIDFIVHWSHQAWRPGAVTLTSADDLIAVITPVADSDYYESGDMCDIYRLSVDGAELIFPGAEFGTKYVDPYPALGSMGGYKLVTVTATGDYITDKNSFAEYDTNEEGDYTQLDAETMIIDFGSERVELQYNLDIQNTFEKDFRATEYLGGSIRGDYNKAIKRTGTMTAVTVPIMEEGLMQTIRSLASYTGICHVRTPDGSSYAANVDISDSWSHGKGGKVGDLSLAITRVDTEGYDGMTYEDWGRSV